VRQLNLFKGPRQRGTTLPPPIERKLHIALADALRVSVNKDWFWSHIPMGEYRTPATAALLQRMGVRRGLPDFIFIGRGFAFLELKRPGEGMSDPQWNVAGSICRAGGNFFCTDNVADALDWLRDLGIVRARVTA